MQAVQKLVNDSMKKHKGATHRIERHPLLFLRLAKRIARKTL
jgi:hypothetical protein